MKDIVEKAITEGIKQMPKGQRNSDMEPGGAAASLNHKWRKIRQWAGITGKQRSKTDELQSSKRNLAPLVHPEVVWFGGNEIFSQW